MKKLRRLSETACYIELYGFELYKCVEHYLLENRIARSIFQPNPLFKALQRKGVIK